MRRTLIALAFASFCFLYIPETADAGVVCMGCRIRTLPGPSGNYAYCKIDWDSGFDRCKPGKVNCDLSGVCTNPFSGACRTCGFCPPECAGNCVCPGLANIVTSDGVDSSCSQPIFVSTIE